MSELDPGLMQDFLTEAGELIERMDADLVTLETAAGTPEAQALLDGIFRALHTIKGAASFLGLDNTIHFAHAAEDALNVLRKGEADVTTEIMDAMLRSADVIRLMIDQLNAGEETDPGPAELVSVLHAIASKSRATENKAGAAPEPEPEAAAPVGDDDLNLPPEKADLLEFMVTDMQDGVAHIDTALVEAQSVTTRADAVQTLAEAFDGLSKTAEFFGLADMAKLIRHMNEAGAKLPELDDAAFAHTAAWLARGRDLVAKQAQLLGEQKRLAVPLAEMIHDLANPTASTAQVDEEPAPTATNANTAEPDETASDPNEKVAAKRTGPQQTITEQTIRVEVSRLEELLNLVGQLVLTKNRVLAQSRKVRDHGLPTELLEEVTGAAGDLDRLTSELQIGVMRTRMQPLAKLFDRYPRVIRDMARMTNKKIHLEIEGKDTEVDKSVLELLADPLVHVLRNSADHGVEIPEVREKAGKDGMGTIRLVAEHQGSHVRVAVVDDGKGIDREVIGRKAVEKGLATAAEVAAMSDTEVFRFIFAPGFSTAEKVTDLSGRGVGMDVVRTNVIKMNGQINVSSVKGKGTTIEILIPLTVAIMPAMMVGIGKHMYAVPLQSVVEIVKPQANDLHTIQGQPVMRLRDAVLPLVDMATRLGEVKREHGGEFAVVVQLAGQRAGLRVDELIGQQEIVIKPLDDDYTKGGPFSGATIREDGDVSLILDINQVLRQPVEGERREAA